MCDEEDEYSMGLKIVAFFIITDIHFPAQLVGCVTLSGLLDKSWSVAGVVSSSLSGQRLICDGIVSITGKMLK